MIICLYAAGLGAERIHGGVLAGFAIFDASYVQWKQGRLQQRFACPRVLGSNKYWPKSFISRLLSSKFAPASCMKIVPFLERVDVDGCIDGKMMEDMYHVPAAICAAGFLDPFFSLHCFSGAVALSRQFERAWKREINEIFGQRWWVHCDLGSKLGQGSLFKSSPLI